MAQRPECETECSPQDVARRLDRLDRRDEHWDNLLRGIDEKVSTVHSMAIEDRVERRGLQAAVERAFGEIKSHASQLDTIKGDMPVVKLTSRGIITAVTILASVCVSAIVGATLAYHPAMTQTRPTLVQQR